MGTYSHKKAQKLVGILVLIIWSPVITQPVLITGQVTDLTGGNIEGCQVQYEGCSSFSTTTGADGKFSLEDSCIVGVRENSSRMPPLVLEGNNISIRVGEASTRITISLYDVSGRISSESFSHVLNVGSHIISLPESPNITSSGLIFLKITIDDVSHVINWNQHSREKAPRYLEKLATIDGETLDIHCEGYEDQQITLDSPTQDLGTLAFNLVDIKAAGWICNKNYYAKNDGCDCDCGLVDPDCNGGASCDAYHAPCPEGQDCFLVTDAYGGRWADVEKDKESSVDDFYCWVAAAANTLEWSGWGIVDGMETTDDIYKYYQPWWGEDYGEDVYDALEWWFIGDQPDEDYPGGGGFHENTGFWSYCNSDESDAYVGLCPGDMADNPYSLQELLDAGFATGVQLKGDPGGNDGSHVFTIWGYSVDSDNPGLMTGVFITNSDDEKNLDDPPDRLYYRPVEHFDDAWHILEADGSPYKYIKYVYGLSQKDR